MGGSLSAFQTLCSRLEDNDPNADVVNTDCFPHFDQEAAQQLGEALKDNQHVQRILLDVTNLSCAGPEDGVTRVASFLRDSSTLKAVLLKSPGLASMDAYVSPTHRAHVGEVVSIFLSALTESGSLHELTLADIDLALPCEAFHRFLSDCHPNLRRLRLSYGRDLEPNEMTILMNAFAQNTTLTGLELTEVPISIWHACLAGVAVNETLHTLNLHHLPINYDLAPLTHLIESNSAICSLSISQSRLMNVAAIATSLQRNESIVELILSSCGIGVQDAVHLKRLVKGCPSIVRLNLSGNHLRAEGLAVLADGLYRNRSLTLLDVSDNELEGVEASRTLGNLLRRNRGLERLDVDHNNWSGPTGMRAFSKGLARNHFVDTLELSRCRLGDHALSILAVHGLRHNSHLEVLALNANMVTATGVEVLVDAMEETRSVHSLFLNDNMLCDEGVVLLARLLTNASYPLKILSVNNNLLGDEGVLALVETLERNQELEFLSLEDNTFGEETMDAMCHGLRSNKSLKQICFTFHDSDWTSLWCDTLATNMGLTTIQTLGFDYNEPLVEAKLDFYAWRNRCRPLMLQLQSSSHKLDGMWAEVLCLLSQKSQITTMYHVLREIFPSRCHGRGVGRKRRAS